MRVVSCKAQCPLFTPLIYCKCTLQVTFLYTLSNGACPKSYGPNVARLAGLPASIVQRASQLSSCLEASATRNGLSLNAAVAADLRSNSTAVPKQLSDSDMQLFDSLRQLIGIGQKEGNCDATWHQLLILAAQG